MKFVDDDDDLSITYNLRKTQMLKYDSLSSTTPSLQFPILSPDEQSSRPKRHKMTQLSAENPPTQHIYSSKLHLLCEPSL